MVVAAIGAEILLRILRPQIFEVHPRGMYLQHPTLGYTLAPDFEGTIRRSEFTVPVRIGHGALRQWDGEGKRSGVFRILVMGDSQAFGFGVGDDETLAWHLEAMLSTAHPDRVIEVINAGIPGYGTADQLAFLRARGEEIDPDLIILQFLSVNDLQENRYPAATWATIEDGMLTAKSGSDSPDQEWRDVLWRSHRYLKLHSHLGRLLSDSAGYLAIRLGWSGTQDSLWGEDFTVEDAAVGEALLVQLAEVGRDLDAESLYLFTTGQAHVLDGTAEGLRSREVLESAARASQIAWIDVATEMSERPDRLDLYYRKDGHWTPQGHRAVAEIVTRHLETGLSVTEKSGSSEFEEGNGSTVVN